jgi:hypothetical protein
LPKKKTQEEFLSQAINIHGNNFDYSKVNYDGKDKGVLIGCSTHGFFEQTPHNHLRGSGCRYCANNVKSDTETFVKKCLEKHDGAYSYERVDYRGAKSKVEITCKVHGYFTQTAGNHLHGQGCPRCSKTQNKEDFIFKASNKHVGKYTYDNLVYIDGQTSVEITCPIHGEFIQKPDAHLAGCGCPKCKQSGYRINLQGNIYILEEEGITKVGITNRSVDTRLKEINRSSGKHFIKKISICFEDGEVPKYLEKTLHNLLEKYKYVSDLNFDGYTETFVIQAEKVEEMLFNEVLKYYRR